MFGLANQEPLRNPDKGPLGVVLSTGEFQITVTDMEIPGRGFPFRLARTYRSKGDGQVSLLGYNWSLSLDEYLTPGFWSDQGATCPAVLWQMGNGFSDVWVKECHPDHNQQWRAGLGFFGMIRPYGTNQGYQIRYPDGTVKTYAQRGLNAQDQEIWILTRVEDRHGNVMKIHHDVTNTHRGIRWITDTLGRKITFEYDLSHRLKSVTDFNNPSRSVVYTYDNVSGDLISARSPVVTAKSEIDDAFDTGKTTTYQYLGADGCNEAALKHNIKSITDGNLHTFLTNTYRAAADTRCGTIKYPVDTVDSQEYGEGTPPPTLTYDYVLVSSGQTAPNTLASTTTVTDRNGNVQVHNFNGQGNPISVQYQTIRAGGLEVRPGEPDYWESYTYVDYGGGNQPMLVSQHTQGGGTNVDSSGNLVPYLTGMTETMTYYQLSDPFQKGNLLSVHRTPGPRGPPAGLSNTITYTYEPLFNQPLTITDPSLHVTTFTYDWQEGTYAQLTAVIPPSVDPPAPVDPLWWPNNFLANYMDPANGYSPKGDLNGDFPLHGYQRSGNLVRREDGVATVYDGTASPPITSYFVYNNFGLPTVQRDSEFNETHFEYFAEDKPYNQAAPATPAPPPEDGRTLSSTSGTEGGGYLSSKILDATADTGLAGAAPSPAGHGRDSNQNPTPQNVRLTFLYDMVGNISQATDGRGVRTAYTINELNQIVQVVHGAPRSDCLTPPICTADPFGYQEQFQYDANNNIIKHRSERRDDGALTSPTPVHWITKDTTYDTLDRKTSETISTEDVPAISLTTSYAYDANGNLRKTVFPAGNAILRIYDERDLLYQEVVLKNASPDLAIMAFDPAIDSVSSYDYDGSGNVIQVTDAEGHKARTGYDGYNRKVVSFDPAFQKSTFSYDIRGNLLEQISYGTLGGITPTPTDPPDTAYPEISRQKSYYDELGRLRRSDVRFFKYIGMTLTDIISASNASLTSVPACLPPRPVDECDPLPGTGDHWVTSLVDYDRLGRIVRTVDENGHASETRYDGLGRKIKTLMNVVSPFTYDVNHPLDNRNAVDYVYDPNGNVTEIIETEYGADRTRASPLLPAQQHRSTFTYDSMNRQIEAKLVGRLGTEANPATPVNLTTKSVYDSRGNKIQVTDPAGGRTKYIYDGLNRLKKTEAGYFWNGSAESVPGNMINTANPDGKITTTYNYDVNSRLVSLVDDNNRWTVYTYDNLGRQTRVTYDDGSYRAAAYNLDSLATSWTHSKGGSVLTVATGFDWLHRVKQIDVNNSAAPGVLGTYQQSFQYDGLGRITSAKDDLDTNNGSQVVLTYNSIGKVLSERQIWRDNSTGGSQSGDEIVESVYNGVGFRTSVVYPGDPNIGPIDRTVDYHPDELNRPESIVDSLTGTITYDFIGGRVLNRVYPNNTKLTMLSSSTDPIAEGFDDARRIKNFANRTIAATPAAIAEYAYGYDNAGNRLFERRVHEMSGAYWQGETYGYDSVYRLINRKEGTLYDSGAIQSTSGTQDFTLDGLGNWKTHKKNSATYNQTINSLNQYGVFNSSLGQRTLAYDFLGNLSNETRPLGLTQFSYDFLNRLVLWVDEISGMRSYRYDALGRRISKNVGGTLVTHFFYDGDRLIQERDGESKVVASYVYGVGSDEVLTRRRWQDPGHPDIFYHTNALGSVTAITTDTGAVQERYKYDAYGQVTFLDASFAPIGSSTVYNNILFTGQYYDTETKLYYYRARTYHPVMGRFLQRDPLGERASLNLYNYVFNNPVNATDPSGMISVEEANQFMSDVQGMGRGGHGSSNWLRDMGSHQANERFFGHNDLTSSWSETVGAMDKAHWEKRAADKQARRDQALKDQIELSKQKNEFAHKQANGTVTPPKAVLVIYYGHGQHVEDDGQLGQGDSDLDVLAAQGRAAGFDVFEVESDSMGKVYHFSEVSGSAVAIVSGAVAEVSGNGPGQLEVDMVGYSRGGGGMVEAANDLASQGVSTTGMADLDGKLGSTNNRIDSPDVALRVFRPEIWTPVQWGAPAVGLHGNVYQGGSRNRVGTAGTFGTTHGGMDQYGNGALGTIGCWFFGGNP